MAERTAAEVLAEKLKVNWFGHHIGEMSVQERLEYIAARLAEDPAITVRTDMVVRRFVLEFYMTPDYAASRDRDAPQVYRYLTSGSYYTDIDNHRIIVRPYPEVHDEQH
jgi:hypothetical protein